MLVSKLLTLLWGVVLIGGAMLFRDAKNPVVEIGLSIASFTYGGLLGVFFLGLFFKKVAEKDAISGFIAQKAPFFSERDILALAAQHRVHPGIVVGQIHKRTERWNLLRKHLVKIRDHLLPAATVDGFGVVAKVKP